jgi:cysteinyl-tRNA synthetase, unknown class
LQTAPDGSRRLVFARLVAGPWSAGAVGNSEVLADEAALTAALLARGIDGAFIDCRRLAAGAASSGRAAQDELGAALVRFASGARLVNPGFTLVIENAAELAVDQRVHRVIDGVARDNLLFGMDGISRANPRTDVIAALHDLNRVKRSGRAVFISEWLADAPAAAAAGQALRELGFIGRIETSLP